jgi:hypothetical protein
MAVDFHNLNYPGSTQAIFSLNDADLEYLKEVLAQYKKLTGVYIDPYGKTSVYQDHVQLIIKLLNEYINRNKLDEFLEVRLNEILNQLLEVKNGLLALGE